MEKSQYVSGSGNLVTLYKFNNGWCVTVINGDITIHDRVGETCGASSLEAALEVAGR